MLRDFKFLRRNPAKNEEPENIPANRKDFTAVQISSDPSRPPLSSIQDPLHNPYPEQDLSNRIKVDNKTPSKAKGKASDTPALPLRTPDKHGGADFPGKNRFGWRRDSAGEDFGNSSAQVSCRNMTPRAPRTVGKAPVPNFSECASTQSTPTKSVSKPPSSIVRGKVDRVGTYGSLYKGSAIVVNSVEVPHFDLKEDPSFWMEHNVQVVIRVRPLNTMERSANGFNRCLKQESAQNITWIGHPENRFRFDHVACETVDQEMLFRMACLPMVENCLSGYNSCMFAYGQTGSGKTYTMLGEIDNLELKPSPHRGMTPRIFEFLFARIQAEEESRRDENLKYHCKCSFLEIYNEQITDLLDPSSTNLLIREDNKQGVYVENLSEFEVHTVSDILSLLTQGSSNRKVAATNMNRESSRSHSVFTCVIESRWENDSTTNLRFARLNLVDLAGSERQKTSGAEGERLKEAANINKSLSTLGHVIMVLVDVAQGKQRHIPYRDSRLTFLLQDSLGGNSKTMIIANVSPSTGSAAETLNTLKFAQRAKMIQNNDGVNEDTTGDVSALQHQIRLLKEELMILKRQNVSRSLTFGFPTVEDAREKSENNFFAHVCDMDVEEDDDFLEIESRSSVRLSNKQLKCLETTLAGALRREQMAETSKKQLEAEIEQLDRLVRQREEDTRSSKMMLRFREDKIQRMESVVSGAIPSESYLLEENRALSEEIQLLQAKLDRNPEVTRFAHENIRLLDQLRRYQEFYEEGEKEILLTEVSSLRNQLLQYLDGNSKQHDNPNFNLDSEEFGQINMKNDALQLELKKTCLELEECRHNLNSCLNENEKFSRELEDMRSMVMNLKCSPLDQEDGLKVLSSVQIEEIETKHESVMTESMEEIVNLQLELDILKIILKEERSSSGKMAERLTCLNRELELAGEEVSSIRKLYDDAKKELEEAKSVIEALESQQILTINETEDLCKTNNRQMKLLSKQELTIKALREKIALRELKDASPSNSPESDASLLKEKVKRIQCSLENAKRLNTWYQNDRESQVNNDEEMDEVRRQAEAETAEVIVCLEEELAVLQQEVQDRHFKEVEMKNNLMVLEAELKEANEKVSLLTNDNQSLCGKLDEKDSEMKALSEEWSLLTSEIEEILADGHDSLADMSDQLEHISSSFPQKRIWISENVGRMARAISEKELIIEELRRCLEDANNTRSDVESMLKSLRGAALAITEAHQRESSEKETQIQCLRAEITAIERVSAELRDKVSEEQERACAFEVKLQAVDEKNISMAEEKVAELKDGVSLLKSCLGTFTDSQTNGEGEEQTTTATHREDLADVWRTELSKSCHDVGKRVLSDRQNSKSKKDSGDRDNTILLLRREIESALQSLKEVQVEMEKLRKDNSLMSKSEQKNREVMNSHASELLNLQETMNSFECQSQLKMEAANQRLEELQQIVLQACSHSHEIKQVLESEVDDAKLIAVQNAAEAACILSKFEEAQVMIKEADIMINGLMIEIERMKLEVKKLKKTNRSLIQEKGTLETQFQNLSSVSNLKSQQCEQLVSDLAETQAFVVELEGIVGEVQTAFKESFTLLSSDFQTIKCQLFDSSKLVRTWLEEIWSEIVVKDCAVSVLHLCHMGVLLETVTGLNAENGLLQNGLCESNAVMADLREHNSKSIKELEMCRVIKGKLLADIKSGFDRISKKEEDSQELAIKLTAFDKKMLDLQNQEESMLQRSNYLGSQLALLIKELDLSNKDLEATLWDQEKVMQSQVEFFMIEWCVKEFESLILASELEETALHKADAERKLVTCAANLEDIKKELVLLQIDSELKYQFSSDKEVEVSRQISFLDQKNQQLLKDVTMLETRSDGLVSELERKKTELARMVSLEKETELLRIKINQLNRENSLVLQNLQAKNSDFETSLVRVNVFEKENHLLKDEISALETRIASLQTVLEVKTSEFESAVESKKTELTSSEKDNELLRIEIDHLKEEKNLAVQNLEAKNSDVESSLGRVNVFERENHSLRDEVLALENRIASLQTVLEVKTSELRGIQESQLAITEELCVKSCELEAYGTGICALNEENLLLREELGSLNTSIKICFDSMDEKLVRSLNKEEGCASADKMLQDISETLGEKTQEFADQLEQLKFCAKDLESENSSLQMELLRKDEVLEGLQFDLSLLQESASKTKDQKDEIEEMLASLEALEDKLSANTIELEQVVAIRRNLETQLSERSERISVLETELSKEKGENSGLRGKLEEALVRKSSVEDELVEAKKVNESLEAELLEIGNAIDRRNSSIEALRSNVHELESERDELLEELGDLKSRLDSEQSRAEEFEAVAKEAQQMAEFRNVYAEEKEAEVKLLERSVEELECTINVLEDKANFVQGEAERQRLLNEELELELLTVKQQLHNVQNNDSDMKRYLEENKKNLQELTKKIHVLEGEIAEKNSEISQFKAHISELNLHAEAQASEYKLKFKALEAMAENVKPDTHFTHALNSSSPKKSEKFSARPRGSGSPFKCIGLGISQQIKSERGEEITAARLRIEELESLAASRQKEIFALNARLATAESMTHDVMRDLLGVKLDMTACASMADDEQVKEITEKIRIHNLESEEMEHEVFKLRKQLTDFIKERQGWLEEIDRKQAEVISAKITIEKLRQNDQLLKAENEMLKIESVNHKQRVRELEGEVKKLSGHQNLHQRIHHHAKIKDENNMLKIRNEELSTKLRHSEAIVARVKEEIAFFRASVGKNSDFDFDFDFDEEKRLSAKLKETEEEKLQLAQKLLGLCTGVLKVAGITKPVAEISPSDAEEALDQLKNTVTTMDRELHDLKYKNKIMNERMRLSELMPQNSMATSRVDENRQTPKRLSQASYFSPLDR